MDFQFRVAWACRYAALGDHMQQARGAGEQQNSARTDDDRDVDRDPVRAQRRYHRSGIVVHERRRDEEQHDHRCEHDRRQRAQRISAHDDQPADHGRRTQKHRVLVQISQRPARRRQAAQDERSDIQHRRDDSHRDRSTSGVFGRRASDATIVRHPARGQRASGGSRPDNDQPARLAAEPAPRRGPRQVDSGQEKREHIDCEGRRGRIVTILRQSGVDRHCFSPRGYVDLSTTHHRREIYDKPS